MSPHSAPIPIRRPARRRPAREISGGHTARSTNRNTAQPINRHTKPSPSQPRPTPITVKQRITSTRRWEWGLQIGFNLLLAAVAVHTLIQILPDRGERRETLAQLEAELSEQEGRVDHLRERFAYYFDPSQLQSVIREESQKVHPQQRPIVWVDAPD